MTDREMIMNDALSNIEVELETASIVLQQMQDNYIDVSYSNDESKQKFFEKAQHELLLLSYVVSENIDKCLNQIKRADIC